MGERLARFLEAVGRLTAAEHGYSEAHAPQPHPARVEARRAARELHDAMTERSGR